jgi:rod shape-determining protein MreD
MTPSPGLLLRSALVLITALVLQTAVLDWHPVASVPVTIFLALAVAGGLTGGSQRGAVLGFAGGCLADLVTTAPFGLSALTLALVGYGVGSANSLRVRQSRIFPIVVGLLAGALGVLLYAVVGELVGQPYLSDPDLVRIVIVRAVGTAVLVVPCELALRWAWRDRVDGRLVLV